MDNINIFEIPVTSEPNQNFRCTIPIDGENKTFIFDVRYNSEAEYWTMRITDDLISLMLIDSIPLLAGVYPAANLLEQYAYLNIGSAYIIKINPDIEEENPNSETLGSGFKLYWSDTR
jgi:hypothetical protein